MIMGQQKIIILLDNTPNHPTKFRIYDDACGTYNTNSQTQFKASMLKSSLCDYSSYIVVSGTITVAAVAAIGGNNGTELVF